MAVDERARHQLHTRLDEVLGPEVTGTLMEYLPPVGWADVATRQDLTMAVDALGHRLDADIANLRTELRTGLAGVRTNMADLRAEMTDLRTETRTGIASLGGELRAEMAAGQRLLLFSMLSAMFALAGLVWGGLTLTS